VLDKPSATLERRQVMVGAERVKARFYDRLAVIEFDDDLPAIGVPPMAALIYSTLAPGN
jgi:hypothetical protein